MATMLIVTTTRIAGGPNPGEPWEVEADYGRRLIAQGKATDASSLKNRLGDRARRAAAEGARASVHDRQALRSEIGGDIVTGDGSGPAMPEVGDPAKVKVGESIASAPVGGARNAEADKPTEDKRSD